MIPLKNSVVGVEFSSRRSGEMREGGDGRGQRKLKTISGHHVPALGQRFVIASEIDRFRKCLNIIIFNLRLNYTVL